MEPMTSVSVAALSEYSSVTPTPHPSESPGWEVVHTLIPPYIFAVCLLGLLFNSFVLGVFLAHKDRLTVAELYLSNLALADFLLLCCLPFWAMNILSNFNWPYGDALCKMVNSAIVTNFYTSIYTLVMISVDRYLAIVQTMKARWLRRTLHAKLICFVLWILGLILSVPTMVHRKVKMIEDNKTIACVLDYDHNSSWKLNYQITMNLVGFVLPVTVILFSSGTIVKVLSQRKVTVGLHDTSESKATMLLYAVTLLFLLCWGPFQVVTFLNILCDVKVLDGSKWSDTLDIGGQVSVYLGFINSALNPLLYVFSGQYFRKKVSSIYRGTRQRRRGSDMTTYQRSVVSTYINRPEQIKPVVLFNGRDKM
ncbi:B1 bradykinin receptor [Aulostomus maculatus]